MAKGTNVYVAPEETAPEERGEILNYIVVDDVAPEETAPEGTAPEETVPEGTAPEETAPEGTATEEIFSSLTDALLERMKVITKPEHIVDAFEHNPTAEELFETSDKQVFLVRQDAVNHSLFLDSKTVKRYKR